VSTVVTAGKRYIRSRLRALKIGGSRERTPVRLRAKRNYDATQGSSMRPGQNNKRMRGRPNNRKGPNPLTRSYESSGPDVKIRGTAHHIGEKYLQLARDAQTSGDPVMAESYLQHAEHYFRLIAAAQQVPQQGPGAYQGQPGEANVEEAEDDSDFAGIPDRFASPAERFAPPQPSLMPQPQPSPMQPGPERSFHNNGDRQGFSRPERAPRPERPFQDRNYRDREYQANPEKPYQEQRPYQERNGRGRDQENRGNRGRGPRDYRNEGSILVDPRAEPQMAEAGIEGNGLPAFITAPVRVPAEAHDAAPPVEALSPLLAGPPEADDAANDFHARPRRRRGGKAETGVAGPHGGEEANADDPVQD
jgi:Domain of unknown function (DUF4167)